MQYRIIDSDQHIIEPRDLWEQWLPKKFQDRAPKLVRDEDGGDAWDLGGVLEPLGLVTVQDTRPKELRWTGKRYEELDPGMWEPKRRLELMDEDGVDAAIIYPPQRTMGYFGSKGDLEFHLAGIRAYNDWVLEAFCSANPDRLGAIAQIPPVGIEGATEELERSARKGARGVSIGIWPSGGSMVSADDDPFWARAEELGMPVHVHIRLAPAGAAPRERVGVAKGGFSQLAGLATTLASMPLIIAQTVFSGVFERFPRLKMVGAESGGGWVPYLLGEMDDRYRRNRYWTGVNLDQLPSDYFRNNWLVGIIRDPYGVQNRHAVGMGNMMWASDFPHHINDWPHSRYLINQMSLGVPEAEKRQIFCENAGRLYGFID